MKWAVLPVANTRFDSSAVAAMIRSASPRGSPPRSASAHKSAVRLSSGMETGSTSESSTSLRNFVKPRTALVARKPRVIS